MSPQLIAQLMLASVQLAQTIEAIRAQAPDVWAQVEANFAQDVANYRAAHGEV